MHCTWLDMSRLLVTRVSIISDTTPRCVCVQNSSSQACPVPLRPGFLEYLKVPPNEWLLHNGASSVLGRELIAMAKRHGTKLINVVRRSEVVVDLIKLGCVTCTLRRITVYYICTTTAWHGELRRLQAQRAASIAPCVASMSV